MRPISIEIGPEFVFVRVDRPIIEATFMTDQAVAGRGSRADVAGRELLRKRGSGLYLARYRQINGEAFLRNYENRLIP